MRRIVVLFVALGLFQFSNAKTVVSGTVKGLRSGEAEISFRQQITLKDFSWKAQIVKGKFSIEAEITEATFADLSIGDESTSIYLMPDQTLKLSVNAKEFDESLEYSGDYSGENNFLAAYFLNFEDEGKDPTRGWYSELDSEAFTNKHKERLDAKVELLLSFNNESEISTEFMDTWQKNETYMMYGTYLYYPMIKAYYAKKSRSEVVHEGYYNFLDNCDFDNEELLDQGGYLFFLDQYLGYKLSTVQQSSSGGYNPLNQFLIAEMALTGKTKTTAQANYLRNRLSAIELSKIDPYWEDFKANCEPEVAEYLQGIYNKVKALQPGNLAPQFTLKNLDGEEVSLNDFKGKVVYIDFWASWCGPCMQQVPYAKALKEEYADNKDMVFLYISIDKDAKAWRQAVEEKELKGVHVLAKDFKHDVPQSYNVSGIPTYYIIGRDGNIYKNNAPRPSSGDQLKDLLNAALKG
ncbi:MAG: TlpA family protein disulfide reductase [Bacteroidia bacterium]